MSLYNKIFVARFMRMQMADRKPDQNARILDLGCGFMPYRGYYEGVFGQCVRTDYLRRVGIDLQSDAQCIPFKDGVFDVVLMNEVIEHLPDPMLAMHEVRRVLKPSGYLLLTWPFIHLLHEIPNDHQRFTEFGIAHLAELSDMEVLRIWRRGNAIVVLAAVLEFFFFGLLVALSRIPLVGNIFQPVQWLSRWMLRGVYSLWMRITHGDFTASSYPGKDLRGMVGHLRLWSLGYCACLRPVSREDLP